MQCPEIGPESVYCFDIVILPFSSPLPSTLQMKKGLKWVDKNLNRLLLPNLCRFSVADVAVKPSTIAYQMERGRAPSCFKLILFFFFFFLFSLFSFFFRQVLCSGTPLSGLTLNLSSGRSLASEALRTFLRDRQIQSFSLEGHFLELCHSGTNI
jgi:hypothetical protein